MPSPLTPRESRVLAAVCDTFQPTSPGEPAAAAALLGRVERLIEHLHPDDRSRLRHLLSALGAPLVNLVLAGRWSALHDLPLDDRVRLLRGWGDSRLAARRAGFQALKRLVNVAYYTWPAAVEPHPAWSAAGYRGRPAGSAAAARLAEFAPADGAVVDCDVVVIGSGAGGGVAAGILAEAGRDVVVIEKGENLGAADFSGVEGEMLSRSFLDRGLSMTRSGSLPLLAGSCVGGGTTINWTTCFPPSGHVRAEWARASGLEFFESARFTEALERVQRRAGVNTGHSMPGRRDQILERGLRALGWHVGVIPRNALGCPDDEECGWCGYGCRPGAKQTTGRAWLESATGLGARLIPRCEARRVTTAAGRATGVEAVATMPDGSRRSFTVRARAVVAAAGALNTPALLRRSGLSNRAIGRNLFLHPVTAVLGRFDERVEPWTGRLQTRYSDQFADQHEGYGAKFETGPVHWALPASAFGWEDPSSHRADVHALGHTGLVGILLRDRIPGSVSVAGDGRPIVHYELSAYDARHLRAAMHGAARVLAAAGARDLMTLQQPPVRARPGAAGWDEEMMRQVDARGLARSRMALISFHQMGTCAMAADPSRGAVKETGESFEARGLYVADGSCFPLSSGVNPMITIMAIADHVARGIAERW